MSKSPILPPGLPPHIAQHTLDQFGGNRPSPGLPGGLPPEAAQHALNQLSGIRRPSIPAAVKGLLIGFVVFMMFLFLIRVFLPLWLLWQFIP